MCDFILAYIHHFNELNKANIKSQNYRTDVLLICTFIVSNAVFDIETAPKRTIKN